MADENSIWEGIHPVFGMKCSIDSAGRVTHMAGEQRVESSANIANYMRMIAVCELATDLGKFRTTLPDNVEAFITDVESEYKYPSDNDDQFRGHAIRLCVIVREHAAKQEAFEQTAAERDRVAARRIAELEEHVAEAEDRFRLQDTAISELEVNIRKAWKERNDARDFAVKLANACRNVLTTEPPPLNEVNGAWNNCAQIDEYRDWFHRQFNLTQVAELLEPSNEEEVSS